MTISKICLASAKGLNSKFDLTSLSVAECRSSNDSESSSTLELLSALLDPSSSFLVLASSFIFFSYFLALAEIAFNCSLNFRFSFSFFFIIFSRSFILSCSRLSLFLCFLISVFVFLKMSSKFEIRVSTANNFSFS